MPKKKQKPRVDVQIGQISKPTLMLDPVRVEYDPPPPAFDPSAPIKTYDKEKDSFVPELLKMYEHQEAAKREDAEMMAFMDEEERLQREARQRKLRNYVGYKTADMDPIAALAAADEKAQYRQIAAEARKPKKKALPPSNPLRGATQMVEHAERGQVWRAKNGQLYAVPYKGAMAGEAIEVGHEFGGETSDWDDIEGTFSQ